VVERGSALVHPNDFGFVDSGFQNSKTPNVALCRR
jgi:hypothetical protein